LKKFSEFDEIELEEEKKKKKFRIFGRSYNKDGPGVEKDELKALENPTLLNFFKLLKRKFGRLITVNLLFLLGNFPLIFIMAVISRLTMDTFSANAGNIFPTIYGVSLFEPDSPVVSSLMGIVGKVSTGYAYNTVTLVLLALSFLILFTFGPVTAGVTYILRNMIREEPVFLWSDFKYAIKRNWKQALPVGIVDIVLSLLLVYDIIWFNANSGGSISIMLILLWALLIIYFFMRLYIYPMLVTFDLKFTKLFKNALIFAIAGFKRNIVALIGIIIFVMLTLFLCIVILPIGIVIPFILLFSLIGFISTYASYPKIKQIMIDPYYAEHPEESPPDEYGGTEIEDEVVDEDEL